MSAKTQLNHWQMVDELAHAGCASDADPVYPGQQKYCSLLLSIT